MTESDFDARRWPSLPHDTYRRVEIAARRLGMSRSEVFAQAAERWLVVLHEDDTTAAINRAISGSQPDQGFVGAAAAALAEHDRR